MTITHDYLTDQDACDAVQSAALADPCYVLTPAMGLANATPAWLHRVLDCPPTDAARSILRANGCLAGNHEPLDPGEAVTRCYYCATPLVHPALKRLPLLHRMALDLIDAGEL